MPTGKHRRPSRARDVPRSTPSLWPIIIALGIGLAAGALVYWTENRDNPVAIAVLALSSAVFLAGFGGWLFQDARDAWRRRG